MALMRDIRYRVAGKDLLPVFPLMLMVISYGFKDPEQDRNDLPFPDCSELILKLTIKEITKTPL